MQQRQFPQAPSHNSDPAERTARRRLRTRSLQAILLAAGSLSLMFVSTGCPEPEDLGGTAGTGTMGGSTAGGGGSGGGAPSCEVQCVTDIFTKTAASCKLCHASMPAPAGLQSAGLDLQSPGYTLRMKDVAAKHTDISPAGTTPEAAGCPTGDKLIDTANPGASWLYKKIKGQQGTCGTAMPQPPTNLTMTEMACMETYITCVAGKPIVPTGGAGGGGAGGASGGGGAGGAGGAGGKAGAGGGGAGGAGGGGAGGGGNGGGGGA